MTLKCGYLYQLATPDIEATAKPPLDGGETYTTSLNHTGLLLDLTSKWVCTSGFAVDCAEACGLWHIVVVLMSH